MNDTGKRRRRYSLKSYLLVIAVLAVAVGWWCDRQRLQAQPNDAKRRIQDLETSGYFDGMPNIETIR